MSTPARQVLKLQAYKTNKGMFVRSFDGYNSQYSNHLVNMKWNGKQYAAPVDTYWIFLDGYEDVVSVEKQKPAHKELTNYKLTDESFASNLIPITLPANVQKWDDDIEEYCWGEYNKIKGLYEPVYTDHPASWEPLEFELTILRTLEIDNWEKPAEMKVKQTIANCWGGSKEVEVALASVVHYDEIEKLLTPEFLLHERPCKISSDQMYSIVRSHIKENINSKNAVITSDYNFCFAVSRLLKVKPYTVRRDVSGPRARKPKYVNQSVNVKQIDLFQMTNATERYKGYTVIEPLEANSLKEMADVLKTYLDSLMEEINRDVSECPHCNGTGHLETNKIDTNDRKLK